MSDEMAADEELTPLFVRDQLDEILTQEITALLDVDETTAMMSFNLASISCITLIIEREREIKHYADFPPERYTRETFVSELVDIGLEKDESLMETIDSVMKKGYISMDEHGQLKAEMPAFMMVGFLDNMFPGMMGMNLVAFVLQMNDEVNSGRKDLEKAKNNFKDTLKSRGVLVSKDRAEQKASEIVSGKAAANAQSREISQKLKKDNLNRLSKLIKTRRKRTLESSERLKVTDVFDKGPTKEEIEAEKKAAQKAEEEARKAAILAREMAQKDEKIKEAEAAAKDAARRLEEIERREMELSEARKDIENARQKAEALAEKEAQIAEKEAQLKALEERLTREAEEKKARKADQQRKEEEQVTSEADIASRIAAFENELSMPCPVCQTGKVVTQTTEKGKSFYSCSSRDCRFVSWDKPYHFECPLCKNSFLTEFDAGSDQKGLKCPRASCAYTQPNLLDPRQNMAAAASEAAPRKKKRIVRRKKKR